MAATAQEVLPRETWKYGVTVMMFKLSSRSRATKGKFKPPTSCLVRIAAGAQATIGGALSQTW